MNHPPTITISVILPFSLLIPLGTFAAAPADPVETLDAYMQEWTFQDMFSGVVLVARNGDVVLHRAYGKADASGRTVPGHDTRFRIGSLTKAFTAMAVLQLEAEGLLSVNDTLSHYLPEYPRGDEITLDMLLNHRSGIVDHTTLSDFQTTRREHVCDLETTIGTFRDLPLDFSPGSKFKYSNSNYILLGLVIEKVAQRPYSGVIQARILDPLGMTRTGFELEGRRPADLAIGYRRAGDTIVPASDRVMQNAHASGALYSTASDLHAWEQAFSSRNPLDRVVLERMLASPQDNYVYGWAPMRVFGRRAWAHAGETEGFTSWIVRFLDDEACVIVLSNFEHCLADRIGMDLAAILFGEPYRFPQRPVATDEVVAHYADYAGTYEIKPGFSLSVTREGRQLFCQPTRQSRLELVPESASAFFFREIDARIVFLRDPEGAVAGLVLHQNGREIPATKQ